MSIVPSISRVQRVRHELKIRELQVVRAETLSPHFRRIVFSGDDLAGFISASFDDHIKLILDSSDGASVRRDYTPRHYDAARQELALDFCLHEAGAASDWAAQASAGDMASIGGPRGSFVIPLDYDWHLLVGDDTALPAIARRLEELPAGVKAVVVLHIADTADRRLPATRAELTVHWCDHADAVLTQMQSIALPDGEGYAWCAGEASMVAAARRILIDEKHHPRSAIRAAAYWKRGSNGHHENLDD
ncbi:MAG: siderophore-interacting protein [Burkholderiales bacterium]|nr:siderophore-interacting protein [Burkholderiales bacterium]